MDVSNQRETLSFADCVRNCAQDETIVAVFNLIHSANLVAPISAVLDDSAMPDSQSDDAVIVACFLGFVHHQIWRQMVKARRQNRWPRLLDDLQNSTHT